MHFRAKLLEGGTVHQRDPAAGSSGRNVYFGCLLTRLSGKFHFGFKFKRKFLELKIGFFFYNFGFLWTEKWKEFNERRLVWDALMTSVSFETLRARQWRRSNHLQWPRNPPTGDVRDVSFIWTRLRRSLKRNPPLWRIHLKSNWKFQSKWIERSSSYNQRSTTIH